MKRIKYTFFLLLLLMTGRAGGGICHAEAIYPQKTNIPTLYIETLDGNSVIEKDNYKFCRVIYVKNDETKFYDSVQIKGRGNATWNLEKKPYRIKFKKKERFLGKDYANAKSWVLLCNGGDALLFRNGLANYVSKLCNMPFTPAAEYVDLYLNGEYRGNYQISDKIEIRKKRVDIFEQDTAFSNPITDVSGGYLLEVDDATDPSNTYIKSPKYNTSIRIHSPEPEVISQVQKDYISAHIDLFEKTLSSEDWRNPKEGWRNYVDSASMMGWYLTNEICANTDIFHQIYFYKERYDNKFYFGPVWDFDHGFNNDLRRGDNGDCTEWLMQDVDFWEPYYWHSWFDRIKTDPWWIEAQYEAYKKLYVEGMLTSKMLSYVDSISTYMRPSIDANFEIWDISQKTNMEFVFYDNYDAYINYLKDFIVRHNEYIYKRFLDLKDSVYTATEMYADIYRNNKVYKVYDVYDILGRYRMTIDKTPNTIHDLGHGVFILINSSNRKEKSKVIQ